MERKKISVVVSVYNEELSLNQFYKTTVSVLDKCVWDYELIFVNDGSQDGSIELLKGFAKENAKVKVVDFSRNFGHEAAMIAGIDHAQGDGVVCMDADLQHPPACIPDIIAKFEDGYEVISMIRTKNADAGIIKRITSGAFYKVLNLMSPVKFENNSSDFKILYDEKDSIREKIDTIAREIYGAKSVNYTAAACKQIAELEKFNLDKLPICMAKTQYSLSDNPALLGRPEGFEITVKEVRVSNGAGFIVALTGDIMTMPGLPKVPAANRIDILPNGEIVGLF